MRRPRLIIGTIAAVTVATLALTACGSSGGKSEAGGKITLDFSSYAWQDPTVAATKDIVAAWNAAHPNVQVKYLPVDPDSVHDKLVTQFAGGSAPDIIHDEAADISGFVAGGSEQPTQRFQAPGVDVGGIIDLRTAGEFLTARQGAGSVHHIAFRATDDAAQAAMVRKLAENHQLRTTEQKDRNYFRSVYFREPGRVLFEIATDPPGFAIDEPPGSLGKALKLPPFLEGRRAAIEAALPKLD